MSSQVIDEAVDGWQPSAANLVDLAALRSSDEFFADACVSFTDLPSATGPSLGLPVDRFDPDTLDQGGRVDALVLLERHRGWLDALQQRLLHGLSVDSADAGTPRSARTELDKRWVREEVACALHISSPVAEDRMDVATQLVTRLPGTLRALSRGELSMVHARAVVSAIAPLDDKRARRVESAILPRAVTQTPAQLRQSLARSVAAADPRTAADRHRAALGERRVALTPIADGMSEVWALLPADAAQRLWARISCDADRLAAVDRAAGGPVDERRNLGERRADALAALADTDADTDAGTDASSEADRRPQRRSDATAGHATDDAPADDASGNASVAASGAPPDPRSRGGRNGPAVLVTVPLSVLLGLADGPGELASYGSIPATMARRIAADPTGTWRRLVTDPLTGAVLDHGRRVYRPPAALSDHVRSRDRTCRFPTCSQPADRCEIDHVHAWRDGGVTSETCLHLLCPRHHHLKHEAGWQVSRGEDGTTRWRSPTGHRYEKPPDDPPPF